MSEPDATEESRIISIADLSAKVDKLAELVSRIIIPGSHAEAQQRTEERLDRPSSIEEQVRAELARAKEQEAAEQAAAGKDQELQSRLAKLEETPPAQPVPRRTRLLGWGEPR